MGPARFPPGEGVNVRPHPHIGIATVTYLFEGEILHRDSLGSYQAIRPGDINLMVAGSGIVHSERERAEVAREERVIHGLQLWLVLPEAQEEIAPAFYHYPSETIPSLDIDGVGELIKIATERGRATRSGIKLGICGEHGGDPASIRFCSKAGLDYVSCSPYRVPIARLAAAQAALSANQ